MKTRLLECPIALIQAPIDGLMFLQCYWITFRQCLDNNVCPLGCLSVETPITYPTNMTP